MVDYRYLKNLVSLSNKNITSLTCSLTCLLLGSIYQVGGSHPARLGWFRGLGEERNDGLAGWYCSCSNCWLDGVDGIHYLSILKFHSNCIITLKSGKVRRIKVFIEVT
jgi:hypothetical protein